MTPLDRKLAEIAGFYTVVDNDANDEAQALALQIAGAQAIKDVPRLKRLCSVLLEQRDEIALRGTKLRFNDFLQMADAAALAALEGE